MEELYLTLHFHIETIISETEVYYMVFRSFLIHKSNKQGILLHRNQIFNIIFQTVFFMHP